MSTTNCSNSMECYVCGETFSVGEVPEVYKDLKPLCADCYHEYLREYMSCLPINEMAFN